MSARDRWVNKISLEDFTLLQCIYEDSVSFEYAKECYADKFKEKMSYKNLHKDKRNILATCPEQPEAVACVDKDIDWNDPHNHYHPEQEQEDMETNMLTSYNNLSATAALPTEQVQMDFLRGEARNVRGTLSDKLRKQFGLTGDDAPATVEELVKRIQDGKFVVDDENKKRRAYYATDYISWRDPAIKKDQAGFDAAVDLLSAKYSATKRAIMTQGADAGLKAVLDLEAFTA